MTKWSNLLIVGSLVVAGGCGGSGPPPTDAGGEAGVVRRGQPLVAMSDERGVVRVGGSAADQSPVLVVDSETQKPIAGVLAEAVAEDEDDGYMVRLSKEAAGYRPEIVRVRRGQPRTVPMGPATADVPGRAVRVSARVTDDVLLGEFDLAQVMSLSEMHSRPDVVFLPALPEGGAAGARFAVYLAALPRTLLALKIDGKRPGDNTVVRGQARVVSMSGARRAGARVTAVQVNAAGEHRAGEEQSAPLVAELAVSQPDATGASMLTWSVADPDGRLLGVEVGIDTTGPGRRLGKDARQLAFNVQRGDHLACVRPVFAGADVEPVVRCLSFAADNAPPAPNVRVSVRAGDPTATARRGAPVVVEVENQGTTDAPGFAVDVVVSRDGRLEGGLGEVRTVWIDGVKAGGRTSRTTDVTAPRDGQFFVVARADGARTLRESNPEDNLDRVPIRVQPAGANRSPVVAMAGTALGTGAGTMMEGQTLRLQASADDPEDGDLSAGLTWWSSRDGLVGTGASLDAARLSPGRHRIRAGVADHGLPAAPGRARPGLRLTAAVNGLAPRALPVIAAPEAPEAASAEIEIEVLSRTQPVGNSPPHVTAGPDLTTTVGGEVSPRALASDPDGDALSFTWSAATLEGTPVALLDPAGPRPRFIAEAAGTFRLTVKVSDGKLEERDEMQVTVLAPAANRAPKLSVTLPQEARVGAIVKAAITAMDDDGDGLTLSYALARPDGSRALLVEADGLSPSFVPDVAGGYELTATADDGRGGRASASARITAVSAPVEMDAGTVPGDDGGRGGSGGSGGSTGAGGRAGTGGGGGSGGSGSFDAGSAETAVVADGGTRAELPPPTDAGVPEAPVSPCDPVKQAGCTQAAEACYIYPENAWQCLLPGTGGEGASCVGPTDCSAGNGCFAGPDGMRCRRYCDPQAPACSGNYPVCQLIPGARWGTCVTAAMTMTDAGPPPPVSCDPLAQTGCSRREDACYAFAGTSELACLLAGTAGWFSPCSVHTDCQRGTGCFDGPNGRMCRPYCRLGAAECPGQAPVCMMIGRSDYGVCAATIADAGAFETAPASMMQSN